MRSRRLLAVLALMAVPCLTLVGCSDEPTGPAEQDILGGGSYSLTQTITNNSSVPLTVRSVRVDNNATVVPGYPTQIPARTPGTFKATNSGNGIQMWVTLDGPAGQVVVVDSDVPHTRANNSTATVSGTIAGVSAGALAIGTGDNPTIGLTLESCSKPSDCVLQVPSQVGP